MHYVYLAIIVAGLSFGGGLYAKYNSAITTAERLKSDLRDERINNQTLSKQNTSLREERTQAERRLMENAQELNHALIELENARQQISEIEGLYAKHDFNYLFQKKPGLILRRANTATAVLFDSFASEINRRIDTAEEDPLPASPID